MLTHTPSGQSRVYRVTQLRIDGVHCRESAGTGPEVLKVVPVTCAAFLQLSPRTNQWTPTLSHIHYWLEVSMLKIPVRKINAACAVAALLQLSPWTNQWTPILSHIHFWLEVSILKIPVRTINAACAVPGMYVWPSHIQP